MHKIIHRSYQRKLEDLGWARIATSLRVELSASEPMHFGCLVRLDDAVLRPNARGFGMHPHSNMEIVSVVLKGQLLHEDSIGGRAVCKAGDIQLISSGSGIMHNESNPSEQEVVEMLQIWILPQKKNQLPTYQHLAAQNLTENRCQLLVSHQPQEKNILKINQIANIYRGVFAANYVYRYHLKLPTHGVYFFVLSGKLKINDEILEKRDGLGLSFFQEINVQSLEPSEVLVLEVPL
jgi:quercetin 2,3-dioxygenase